MVLPADMKLEDKKLTQANLLTEREIDEATCRAGVNPTEDQMLECVCAVELVMYCSVRHQHGIPQKCLPSLAAMWQHWLPPPHAEPMSV